jgi:hypothetical protein
VFIFNSESEGYMSMHRSAMFSWAAPPVGLLAASVLALTHPDPVQAQTSVTTCAGTSQAAYSPGLTLVPRSTSATFSESYGTCTSTSQPAIASATTPPKTVVDERSCATLLNAPPDPVTQTVTWSTGQTSTFQYTRAITNVGGVSQITGTGIVTSGLFQGASVVKIVIRANLDPLQTLACTTPGGLTQESTGTVSLTFTQL